MGGGGWRLPKSIQPLNNAFRDDDDYDDDDAAPLNFSRIERCIAYALIYLLTCTVLARSCISFNMRRRWSPATISGGGRNRLALCN